MMRWALALVVLALACVSLGQTTREEWEVYYCGAKPANASAWSVGPECMGGAEGSNQGTRWVGTFVTYSAGNYIQYFFAPEPGSAGAQCKSQLSYGPYLDWGTYPGLAASWPGIGECVYPPELMPEPDPDPEPSECSDWVTEDTPDGRYTFSGRECSDGDTQTYDGTYSTPCKARSAFGMTWEEFQDFSDEAAAAWLDPCDGYEPILPDDPTIACTGTDGIACESTQQEVLYVLGLMLQQMQQERDAIAPPVNPPVQEIGEWQPPFDNSQPGWEEWRAPEVTEVQLGDLVTLIETRAAAVMAAGADRLPFGLIGWVPEATMTGAGACVNPSWTILRTSSEIGWCDSAPEAWLAGTGRALSLILATFAFGFAVVRTVAWA